MKGIFSSLETLVSPPIFFIHMIKKIRPPVYDVIIIFCNFSASCSNSLAFNNIKILQE